MTEEIKTEEKVEEKPKKKREELEKFPKDRLRGRIVILNPEESEFAKNLEFGKKGDYFKKK
ncbi:hypothetical protein CMI46_02185 [Candidatus Pacearchaeota archaeon]|nr:hypothetical protein [Candidatus Pacearchaeota archaeon]|tara:strand:+ start:4038 stop:4220 length:183 start_codon:yes stop_codon:yes gene_type:complete